MKSGSKIKAVAVTVAVMLLWIAIIAAAVVVSDNYPALQGTPENVNARMDWAGMPIGEAVRASTIGGWELYYDEWLVTDGATDVEPDLMLRLPGRWTGERTNGGGTLPRGGYASCRMTVTGLAEGMTVNLERNWTITAWRGYINGELCAQSGTAGRTAGESHATGETVVIKAYTVPPGGGTLDIVIEVGYNDNGGMMYPVWLTVSPSPTATGGYGDVLTLIMIGIVAASVVYSVITGLATFKRDKNQSLILLIASVGLHFCMTKEVLGNIEGLFSGIDYLLMYHIGVFSAMLVLAVFLATLVMGGLIKMNRAEYAAFGGVMVLAVVLYIALWGMDSHFIFAVMLVAYFFRIIYKLLAAPAEPGKYRRTYASLLFGLVIILLFELIDDFAILSYGPDAAITIAIAVLSLVLCILSFLKVKRTTDDALRLAETEREMIKVRQDALKSQIKPRFVFKSLSGIQAMYHESLEKGDSMLERFARHLRTNVDSAARDLITFDEEVDNIMNYVELENIRSDGRVPLLLDTDETDFKVPILSLQPLIENAIKHSGVVKKEDGYVQIQSYEKDNRKIIVISDNGCGFDASAEGAFGVGLKNVTDRFRFFLGADVSIHSAPGMGCRVEIRVPPAAK